jgi:hypothetical protein
LLSRSFDDRKVIPGARAESEWFIRTMRMRMLRVIRPEAGEDRRSSTELINDSSSPRKIGGFKSRRVHIPSGLFFKGKM